MFKSKRCIILITMFCVGSIEVSAEATQPAPSDGDRLREKGMASYNRILRELGPILKQYNSVARITYASDSDYEHELLSGCRFPVTDTAPRSSGESAVEEIRSIFRHAHNVVIAEARPGVISITIGRPAADLLKTRVGKLRLTVEEQYNASLALEAVQAAPQVRAAEKRLSIRSSALPCMCLVQEPAENVPHLPSEIANSTMEEAIDIIALTFGYNVSYGECAPPRQYTIRSSPAWPASFERSK